VGLFSFLILDLGLSGINLDFFCSFSFRSRTHSVASWGFFYNIAAIFCTDDLSQQRFVTIMCLNDELSLTMSFVGGLLTDSGLPDT